MYLFEGEAIAVAFVFFFELKYCACYCVHDFVDLRGIDIHWFSKPYLTDQRYDQGLTLGEDPTETVQIYWYERDLGVLHQEDSDPFVEI